MNVLKKLSNSAPGLLLCLVAGGVTGAVAEGPSTFAWVVGQLYLAVVNMAAVPLLVVATFFGLRQVLALPRPAVRVGTILAVAVVLVALAAAGGTMLGLLATPGAQLSHEARSQLGTLVLNSTGSGGEVPMTLFAGSVADALPSRIGFALNDIVPDNFYRVLAQGHTLGILTGTILFGMAFAALSREQSGMLTNVFEGIYRALEHVIEYANLLIPVLAFGTAAHLTMHTQRATVLAMGSFLLDFIGLALLLCVVAIAVMARIARLPFLRVLADLKAPLLVGLTSGSATAPIPHTIEAMSVRLGFSRGVVELVVPLGSVFVRAGSALYFALATVFVANLYDRPIGPSDIVLIAVGSTVAAILSSGQNGLGTVGYAAVVLSALQLPVEAAGALFIAIDLICDGPRNVLSLVSTCAVVALVSAGLPSERVAPADLMPLDPRGAVLTFSFSRAQLALATGCALMVASLIVLMGIGVGAR